MQRQTSEMEAEPADRAEPPRARLCHQTNGRFRVRVSDHRRDDAYLESVRESLGRHPSVVGVETAALTGSVLVSHRGEADPILAFAADCGLFVVSPAVARESAVVRWLDALDRFDTDFLFPRMNDRPQRAATGLFMLAVLQALRGSIIPSAPSLLGEAMALLRKARTEPTAGEREDS